MPNFAIQKVWPHFYQNPLLFFKSRSIYVKSEIKVFYIDKYLCARLWRREHYVTIKVTMTLLFPSRWRSTCETSQLDRMSTKTIVLTSRRRRNWFRRAARRRRREGFTSCLREPTIAYERRKNAAGRILSGVV